MVQPSQVVFACFPCAEFLYVSCFLFCSPCGFQGKREKPAVEEIEASGIDSFVQKGLESNSYVPRLELKNFSMNFLCLLL